MQETAWLDALHRGDLRWFPELVETYQHRIYALAYRKSGNTADAEDLAQEIFLQFYRKLPQFRGEAALSTWLFRVALNAAASYCRKHRRRDYAPGELPGQSGDEPPDAPLLQAERAKAVQSAMMQLGKQQREVLELFYFQQFSTADIAKIVGIAPRSVETRLRRARAQMKAKLSSTGYFEEVDGDVNHAAGSAGEMA